MTEHRMQWYDETLIDQIIAGTKTATVRPLEWSEGLDAFNTALHVGATYTVYNEAKVAQCQVRVSAIELARWDTIPEALWRRDPAASGAVSLEAFIADHDDYFGNPADDFEFLALFFDRIDSSPGP
jgi:uncharacterized protein YhfF